MIGYSKRIEKIIRESAFDEKIKKPWLKFNPGLALTGVQKTGPRHWTMPTLNSKADKKIALQHNIFFGYYTSGDIRATIRPIVGAQNCTYDK